MAQTIAGLIEQLQDIEDKSQPCIGVVWIAEDFETEDDNGNEVKFTPRELAEVTEWRSIEKSIYYLYNEVMESLHENREGDN